MHNLPLPMSESHQQEKVPVETLFVVHEVMSNSNQPDHQRGAQRCKEIWVFNQSYSQACEPDSENEYTIHFGSTLILNLFFGVFLQQSLLKRPIKPIFLEGEPGNFLWAVLDVILGQQLPGLSFVDVVDNKMLSNVLALCKPNPALASWMFADKLW